MEYIPHDYQKYATEKIMELPACGLFLDMGLGKTVSTLTAIDRLVYEEFAVSRVLVIAPKRVADDTWTTEADKWDHLHRLRISKVLGTPAQRRKALETDADIYVINRENVTWLVEHYGRQWPFDMIVVDELSSFKSNQALRFQALRKVRPLSGRFVGLTGTPAPNSLMDLWPEMYLIDRGERLGKTIGGYRQRYFNPGKRDGYVVFNWEPKDGAREAIFEKISDICISMKADDYLKLPGCIVNDIRVRMDGQEQELYRTLEREHLLQIGEKEITALTAGTAYGKLLQLANGAVYDNDGNTVQVHDRKLDALGEILEAACGKPVLVFYSFRHDFERIRERFGGETLETAEDIHRWNRKEIPLLLAHPASMGHGLNMQAGGNIIVWFGMNPSLELYQQANKRLDRQGQTEVVVIHRIINEGTFDEDVAGKLEKKDAGQEELMEAVKARIRRYRGEDKD